MTDSEFEMNIRQMQQGVKGGLQAVYEFYHPVIYSVVLELLHNRQSAEDVTADFFIKLWTIADQYRFGGKHKAWLITIAHNMALDYRRKYSKEQLMDEIPEPENAISPEDLICGQLTLEQVLNSLEEEERQIVNLKIMGDLTLKEISRILKKPLGTVAWRYRVALGKLKRCTYE